MPYTISKEFTFAAAHSIPGHPGKCRNLHGHNYKVRVFLEASQLDDLGMVVDFSHLKAAMREIVDPFDHQILNEIPPFDRMTSTAENLAGYIHGEVERRLGNERVRVRRVDVWETETSCASFEA